MDRGAWRAAVSGVAQSRTRLKRLSSSSSKLVHIRENQIKQMNKWIILLIDSTCPQQDWAPVAHSGNQLTDFICIDF